jgi:hypothetical protein
MPLVQGNPRYQSQVYNALIALLSSASYEAQKMAAYTLRQVQDSMDVVSGSIVDPVLQLLKSLHIDLQQEGGCGSENGYGHMALGGRFKVVGPQLGDSETTPILGHTTRRAGVAIGPWPMVFL